VSGNPVSFTDSSGLALPTNLPKRAGCPQGKHLDAGFGCIGDKPLGGPLVVPYFGWLLGWLLGDSAGPGGDIIPQDEPSTGNSCDTNPTSPGRRAGRDIAAQGVHWEEEVRQLSGGQEEFIQGRQFDSVTDTEIIEAKNLENISSAKNFLSQSMRAQIKDMIKIASEEVKKPVWWFKDEPLPGIRHYIESHGGTVRVGR